MKKNLLLLILCIFTVSIGFAQDYLDQFDQDNGNYYTTAGFTVSVENSEFTITGDGSNDPFNPIGYILQDDSGNATTVDMTENNTVFIRAKASAIGTQLRLDLKDAAGYVTSLDALSKTVVNDYVELEFVFSQYQDGGYGGTSCDAVDAPCPVDASQISEIQFFINPGQPGYQGTVVLDYISFGDKPSSGPMSDVYQDVFESETSAEFISYGDGHSGTIENGVWSITGDGTAAEYNPMVYFFHNMTTLDTADIDLSAGENKIFIRMKANVDGVAVRFDAQDIDGFITTQGSVTKIVSSEYKTYEYDLTGLYEDLGYGGTPCTSETAPCEVDPTRIGNLTMFITPGVAGFAGQIDIEYISIGTALEEEEEDDNVLVYGDHFSDGVLNAFSESGEWLLEETDSELIISGDGSAAAYSSVAYTPIDSETGEPVVLDLTGNNKVFIEGRSSVENTLMRVDLIDTAGYVTSLPALTNVLSIDNKTLEYDFTAQYTDAGYGGTSCLEADAPCPVDPTAISTILLYPNPDAGGFNGTINLEYISTGGPMGSDIPQYTDEFENGVNVVNDPGGFSSSEMDGELILTGDGSAGAYAAFEYMTHNQGTGSPVIVDLTLNNLFYVKAKSSVDGAPLRVDVIDSDGYVANFAAKVNNLTTDYAVYEFDFTDAYLDGGYGGSPCDAADAPCSVNGSSISNLLFYIDADNGAFDGTVTIDWISTQTEIMETVDPGPVGIDDYSDLFENGDITNVEGMAGLVVTEENSTLTITGDGTSGEYSPIVYTLHDQTDETTLLVNAASNNNLLYVRAKSSVDTLPLRIDLQDNPGYVTSLAGLTQDVMGDDFNTYEYDFTNVYQDGGYGGTPCDVGPCDVDAERISGLQIFILPGVGAFDGTLDIDWISFGSPIVGITNSEFVIEVKVFPNPTNGQVNILSSFSNSIQNVEYSIYDLAGKRVITQSASIDQGENVQQIDVSGLNTGAYFLNATANGKLLFNSKLIVK